ncbi:uncharacterized protein [Antedon mediterranea]|uniref:uncharacterized protein n=1 Tax=Antedon mediterranea TaxID=105859 RepID=UPI003AF5211D
MLSMYGLVTVYGRTRVNESQYVTIKTKRSTMIMKLSSVFGVVSLVLSYFLTSLVQAGFNNRPTSSDGVSNEEDKGHLYIQIDSPTNGYEFTPGQDITITCNATKKLPERGIQMYEMKMWFCDINSDNECPNADGCPTNTSKDCSCSGSDDIMSFAASHTIRKAREHDSGIYSCAVYSHEPIIAQRTVNKHINISIKQRVPLNFNKKYTKKRTISTKQGNMVDLICICNGYPSPSVTWYRNEQLLSNETNKWVSFRNISKSDEGSYHCMCENRLENITSEKTTIEVKDHSDVFAWKVACSIAIGFIFGMICSFLCVSCIYKKYFNTKF